MKSLSSLLASLAMVTAALAADAPPSAEHLDFFEKKIRPVLADKCYKCHSESANKINGGLVLDTRAGIRGGGDSGPAVVPGDVKESILAQAISYTHKEFAMPPEKDGGKLPDSVIKDFESWIRMGAPDPRASAAKVVQKADAEAAKNWWSYQPIKKPAVPTPSNPAWARADIDRFIAAGHEARKLKPVPDADPATLFRRLHFTITGLPPSPAETSAFLKEWPAPNHATAAAAQEATLASWIDRLLARPQFGEH